MEQHREPVERADRERPPRRRRTERGVERREQERQRDHVDLHADAVKPQPERETRRRGGSQRQRQADASALAQESHDERHARAAREGVQQRDGQGAGEPGPPDEPEPHRRRRVVEQVVRVNELPGLARFDLHEVARRVVREGEVGRERGRVERKRGGARSPRRPPRQRSGGHAPKLGPRLWRRRGRLGALAGPRREQREPGLWRRRPRLRTVSLAFRGLARGAWRSSALPIPDRPMAAPLDTIVSLAKRRGFIFQSSDIYGGLNGCWDYGPLGVELLRNVKEAWWREMTYRDDIEGLDASILMHPRSGGVGTHRLLCRPDDRQQAAKKISCRSPDRGGDREAPAEGEDRRGGCARGEARRGEGAEEDFYRLIVENEIRAPGRRDGRLDRGAAVQPDVRDVVGPVEDSSAAVYLRPETAQGIFVNFNNVLQSSRQKIPFGIAQIGKAFRNEINTRNFLFRTREFEQMEMQWFVPPGEDEMVKLASRAAPVVCEVRSKGREPPDEAPS